MGLMPHIPHKNPGLIFKNFFLKFVFFLFSEIMGLMPHIPHKNPGLIFKKFFFEIIFFIYIVYFSCFQKVLLILFLLNSLNLYFLFFKKNI